MHQLNDQSTHREETALQDFARRVIALDPPDEKRVTRAFKQWNKTHIRRSRYERRAFGHEPIRISGVTTCVRLTDFRELSRVAKTCLAAACGRYSAFKAPQGVGRRIDVRFFTGDELGR
jgi:hypothetical protein